MSKTIGLNYPLKKNKSVSGMGDVVTSEVIIRRPIASDMRGLSFIAPFEQASMMRLMSRVTGMSEADIGELDLSDYNKICNIIGDMMTGKA